MTNTKDFDWEREIERRLNFKGINGYSLENIVDNISHLNSKSPADAKRYFKDLVIKSAFQDRQQLLKAVEEMGKKYQSPLASEVKDRVYDCDVTSWNQALSEVIDLLKAKDYMEEFDNQIPREGDL